jgi:uncharacterized membrane protein
MAPDGRREQVMGVDAFFTTVTTVFELLGVATMLGGFVVAAVLSLITLVRRRDAKAAYITLRNSIGLVILLGLEILVAADLVKTVTSTPSLTDAAVLGIIVLIRTVLSFSLQIEIEGMVPWKRAMLTSPQLMARAARAARAADADKAE